MVRASHNPKEYNGYEVYDEHGCHLVSYQAKQVISYVDTIIDYYTINFKDYDSLIQEADLTDNFVYAVLKQRSYKNKEAKVSVKVVYTPRYWQHPGLENTWIRWIFQFRNSSRAGYT